MRTRKAVAIVSAALGLIGFVIAPAGAAVKPVTVTASAPSLTDSGGSVTIRATVESAKTCAWRSSPEVKGFDGSVKCSTKLSRVAKLPTNTTMCVKRFTFSLDTLSGNVKASGSAIVTEAGTMKMVCAG
jgi:hypothetical protein